MYSFRLIISILALAAAMACPLPPCLAVPPTSMTPSRNTASFDLLAIRSTQIASVEGLVLYLMVVVVLLVRLKKESPLVPIPLRPRT